MKGLNERGEFLLERVTIQDVAKSVGVSVTTISRYLNGNFKKMIPKTRASI